MCPSQTVVMFIEVHHLEPVELIRDNLNLLLLVVRDDFDALSVPSDILSRGWLSFVVGLEGAIGSLASVNVMQDRARHDK
jgi:hypothetical protein